MNGSYLGVPPPVETLTAAAKPQGRTGSVGDCDSRFTLGLHRLGSILCESRAASEKRAVFRNGSQNCAARRVGIDSGNGDLRKLRQPDDGSLS